MSQSQNIGKNPDRAISDFRTSAQSFINENCHNSRINHDIEMKFGPVTKLDKGNTSASKKFIRWLHVSKLRRHRFIFQFMANLQPFGGQILDAWSLKLTFSLITTFYLQNLKTVLKISNTALILLLWVKVLVCQKMLIFCKKNADISKMKEFSVLKGIFSEPIYVCLLLYQIWNF